MIKRIISKFKKTLIIISILLLIVGVTLRVFHKRKLYHQLQPVEFTASSLPCIQASIENVSFPVLIDLGSRELLIIQKECLSQFHKHLYGTTKWKSYRGTTMEYPIYKIPKIQFGIFTAENMTAAEVPIESQNEYLIWRSQDQSKKKSIKPFGYLGLDFFIEANLNLLLDCENSILAMSNNLSKLRKAGYDLSTFYEVPFKISTQTGIYVPVQTDLGTMKLGLDTGSTITALKMRHCPKEAHERLVHKMPTLTSNQFKIGSHDFGKRDIHFLNITEEFTDIDGVLGMDFLENHVFYIDFSKKTLYIELERL